MKKIVLATGGFDPLHYGHIEYLKGARNLAIKHDAKVIVGVNSDEWLIRKKGNFFITRKEREMIISHLRSVDYVLEDWNDDDDTAIGAIQKLRWLYPKSYIYFVNGGDRTSENIPEMNSMFEDVEYVFGVGGDKKLNSSSWLLHRWKYDES